MANFVAMSPGEFLKLNSQTSERRIDILRRLMKNGEAMPTVDGVEIVVKNTPENIEAIDRLEKDKKTQILDTSKGKIATNKIGKSNVFGGGGGGSGGGSKQTAMAESLQCLYCEYMVNNPRATFESIQPSDLANSMSKVSIGGTSMNDAVSLDASWHYSSYWTAKELLRKKYINSSMTFHRDDKVMKAIYSKKKEALKNSGMANLSDDKWNPGDIWAVTSQSVITSLPTTSIQELNASLVKLFDEKKLVGISLKKIIKFENIKCIVKNEEPNAKVYKFKDGRLMATFARKASEFWRSKSGVVEFDGGKADLRTSSQFAAINFEITLKTARGGRAGYGQIIESLRKRAGKKAPDNKQLKKIAEDLSQKAEGSRYANLFFAMAKKVHPTVQKNEFMSGFLEYQAHEIHSKMGATYVLSCLFENKTNGKADKIITDLVNYAGSELDISSIYAKVYE